MYEEIFQELHLSVIELPIEWASERPVYSGYLKELPFITGEGQSRKELYRQLVEKYQTYREEQLEEAEVEEEETLLSAKDFLRYYDGETPDDFSWFNQEENE
ncbi:hypothetical protein [Enterococcus pallens]|uniref:HicB-like antitoxin of toxin-antitoxin system domain-containing protein n=1 Tax=Enterococcus pallens ATCC BAA-351 TaxID=1158607 RepID=R2Q3H2_9ENTE|nr:hypothetical protein [Enterococcus pallens]EOH91117.1 hypothetical protein UAU_03656 [Enterococcus pallens ATCC BAA-351]EOU16314.1 hypothetical protein I588_03970 [Enterococcus pallens ATCC BAA-351]OJG78943.1 hypothetical protein RV10_GL001066 [Enterococcus pallens]